MKKYNLLKLVAVAFVAGVCTSGQTPNTANQELAMTRCTKPANDDSSDDTRGRRRSDGGCGRCTSEVENQSDSQSKKRKSAASKVIEGLDAETVAANQKSAAQKAMEAELKRDR
ncbi:MAG: hypothetical protein COT85_06765 [Chlamydiae bacterium CG10_big_fil_rev_8_21_14_0_10_42_34]|nr:MAG: hypothetical protein COT85_06765 [Chlamydiae bacterium CG10_big_fil_rev_8_21_14_0_10_42_34]